MFRKAVVLTSILFSLQGQAASLDSSAWSLRFLARASNLLLVSNDQLLDQKKALCDLKAEELQTMTQNLKSLIDEKIQNMTTSGKTRILQQSKSCEKECTCDIYSLYLESAAGSAHQELSSEISGKASQMKSSQRLHCAQNFKEFCTSELLKKIR